MLIVIIRIIDLKLINVSLTLTLGEEIAALLLFFLFSGFLPFSPKLVSREN